MTHPTPPRRPSSIATLQPIRPQRVGSSTSHATAASTTLPPNPNDPSTSIRRVDRTVPATPIEATHSQDSRVHPASRLITDTARDLRFPLASMTAVLSDLSAGRFGNVPVDQLEPMQAALRNCEYLDAIVAEMLHADESISSMARVRRRPTRPRRIAQIVAEATADVLAKRRIELAFDGVADSKTDLYVDADVVAELLTHLVVQAERSVTPDSHLLIRAIENAAEGVVRWSVVDSGRGMSTDQIERLSLGEPHHDLGMNWKMCRQLAAMNFSTLTIRSRLNSGTDITFDTPISRSRSLATAYAKFRGSTLGRGDTGGQPTTPTTDEFSSPHATASIWSQCTLGLNDTRLIRQNRLAVGTLNISDEASIQESDRLDEFLQSQLGQLEMSYQTHHRGWVWVFDADHRSVDQRIQQITSVAAGQLPGVSLIWGEPSITPISQRHLQRILVDRMVKQTLTAASTRSIPLADHDAVRLGTGPIATTPIAANRLDEELQRLASRMRGQNRKIQNQAQRLRPPVL